MRREDADEDVRDLSVIFSMINSGGSFAFTIVTMSAFVSSMMVSCAKLDRADATTRMSVRSMNKSRLGIGGSLSKCR